MKKKISKTKILLGISIFLYLLEKLDNYLTREDGKKELKDQVVIITGASEGIGKAIALELAKYQVNLVLAARTESKLLALAEEIRKKYNTKVLTLPTDVSKEEDTKNLINKTLETFGHIDILINNAGIATYSYFHKEEISRLRKVMEINYWGTVYCTSEALPSMIERKKGKIVNVSSIAGLVAFPTLGNYSATKHAVNGFSNALRSEVAQHNINVILVCPGSTKTDIVKNSEHNKGININPEDYRGMSPEKVAKRTVKAILDNKPVELVGIESIGAEINRFCPAIVRTALRMGIKFIAKE